MQLETEIKTSTNKNRKHNQHNQRIKNERKNGNFRHKNTQEHKYRNLRIITNIKINRFYKPFEW